MNYFTKLNNLLDTYQYYHYTTRNYLNVLLADPLPPYKFLHISSLHITLIKLYIKPVKVQVTC